MRKFLITILSSITAINGYALDIQHNDYRTIDHLIRFGTCFLIKEKETQKTDYIDLIMSQDDKTYEMIETRGENHFSEALKAFRSQEYPIKQRTLKGLRNTLHQFYHQNGLDTLFKNICIDSLEVVDIEQLDGLTLWKETTFSQYSIGRKLYTNEYTLISDQVQSSNKTLNGAIGRSKEGIPYYTINPCFVPTGVDRDSLNAKKLYAHSKKFFYNPLYDNIAIGTNPNIFLIPNCCCKPDSDNNYIGISMKYALEGYESIFSHESGHAYVMKNYPILNDIKEFNFGSKQGAMAYSVNELVAWIFEFRYILDQQTIDKGDLIAIGMRLAQLMDENTLPYEYHCMNLALSLASQKDKKLVDIADKTIYQIKHYVTSDKYSVNTNFSVNSNSNEYGITKDHEIRYNRQKNLLTIKEMLDKLGVDGGYIIDNANTIIKDEIEKVDDAIIKEKAENMLYISEGSDESNDI